MYYYRINNFKLISCRLDFVHFYDFDWNCYKCKPVWLGKTNYLYLADGLGFVILRWNKNFFKNLLNIFSQIFTPFVLKNKNKLIKSFTLFSLHCFEIRFISGSSICIKNMFAKSQFGEYLICSFIPKNIGCWLETVTALWASECTTFKYGCNVSVIKFCRSQLVIKQPFYPEKNFWINWLFIL